MKEINKYLNGLDLRLYNNDIVTMKIDSYINNLNFRVIFDEEQRGRIYVLDRHKPKILFIVDIPDNCIYINQDIIDELSGVVIETYLYVNGIELDLFPYFSEQEDVEKLKQVKDPDIRAFVERIDNMTISKNYISLFASYRRIYTYDRTRSNWDVNDRIEEFLVGK